MKIVKRILRGKLKGYTIRQSKNGWYALYSPQGISLTFSKKTLKEVKEYMKLINPKFKPMIFKEEEVWSENALCYEAEHVDGKTILKYQCLLT